MRECRSYLGPTGGSYLQYIVAGNSLYVIAITGKDMAFLELGSRTGIDSLAAGFGTALRSNDLPGFKSYSFALYNRLIAPVRSLLPPGKRLVISAEGNLQDLPWEALISSDQGQAYGQLAYLLGDYRISYSPGITSLYDQQTIHAFDRKTTGSFFSFAPGFTDRVKQTNFQNTHDSSFMRLIRQPWALQTASSSAELFNGVSYTGMDATCDAYFQRALHAGILHFGTHARWNNQNPMLSRLYLVPGKKDPDAGLYTYDIFAHPTRAKLAVLAACQTGVSGDDVGLGRISLAKAFSFAGCPNQVMTLWDVDDQATAAVIENFYALLKDGKPVAEAMQAAKQQILKGNKDQGWANPYYWSGIVYFGNDEPISLSSNLFYKGDNRVAGIAWVILLLLTVPLLLLYLAALSGVLSRPGKK